jgi:hypothetical protein
MLLSRDAVESSGGRLPCGGEAALAFVARRVPCRARVTAIETTTTKKQKSARARE